MKMVIFCHPAFASSKSMPRFAQLLTSSYEALGHEVVVWRPEPKFYLWFARTKLAKWAGYIDQYVRFPRWVRRTLMTVPQDTLFVFCDQALGPWVHLVRHRPHVVHVHDLLALRSALGEITENPTRLSGRIYQRYIRRGFRKAKHFISISQKSREDLHLYGGVHAEISEVVYNGLNYPYAPLDEDEAQGILREAGLPEAPRRMLLHVGGGQWYKNQAGLIALYAAYATEQDEPLPLWCVSPPPNARVRAALDTVPAKGRVLFFNNWDSRTLQAAYSYAAAFLFPSLAEGFGWPIIEAMSCRCPVITTDEPPMNEIAGTHAFYLPRLRTGDNIDAWAATGAAVVRNVLALSAEARERRTAEARVWCARYDADKSIEGYLAIYRRVLGINHSRPRAALTLRDEPTACEERKA